MEDRAKYVLIGLFTFAVIAGAFGFVYWLYNAQSNRESANYRVIFSGSVSGLRVGAPVMFNGIRVGQVTGLGLTDNPSEVSAILAVDRATPVRADTRVTLQFAGLTGIASVSLEGALASAPPLESEGGEPPTLKADTSASQDLSASVRESLSKVDAVIVQNQESLHKAIKNLEEFTEALARNGDKIDKVMEEGAGAMESMRKLGDNLDERTAVITSDVHKVTETANKQIDAVGKGATRAMSNIEKAITDLAANPQRFLFGGGPSSGGSQPNR
jgi:phospholipid/cholesterol/gamma-HCH transport system substrate-binding protein